MIIRSEQMDALRQDLRRRQVLLIARHMRSVFPEKAWIMGDDAFGERVDRAIDRALGHGIDRLADLAGFVRLTLELGDAFETRAPFVRAAPMLADPSLSGEEKVAALEELLCES